MLNQLTHTSSKWRTRKFFKKKKNKSNLNSFLNMNWVNVCNVYLLMLTWESFFLWKQKGNQLWLQLKSRAEQQSTRKVWCWSSFLTGKSVCCPLVLLVSLCKAVMCACHKTTGGNEQQFRIGVWNEGSLLLLRSSSLLCFLPPPPPPPAAECSHILCSNLQTESLNETISSEQSN